MKPIFFNTDMVRAILEGRKTVTRRLVKPQPFGEMAPMPMVNEWPNYWRDESSDHIFAPPYHPGDILYVRETWMYIYCHRCGNGIAGYCFNGPPDDSGGCYMYRASHEIESGDARWRPSIHMPREAARLFMRVTAVRAERLQDCGNPQAKDEGCTCCSQFARLWDSIIEKNNGVLRWHGWAANPWVWVIEFEKIAKEDANDNG